MRQQGAWVSSRLDGVDVTPVYHEYVFTFGSNTRPGTGSVTLNSGAFLWWMANDVDGLASGHVVLNSGARLKLGPGNYWFKSLTVNSDAVLELDNEYGGIRILVGDPGSNEAADPDSFLILRGDVRRDQAYDENVLIGFAGSSSVPIAKSVPATIVAPHAKVELYSQSSEGYQQMAVFGYAVELHQNTAFKYRYLQDWKFTAKAWPPVLRKAFASSGQWQYPLESERPRFEGWQGVTHDDDYWFSSHAICNSKPCTSHLWATRVGEPYDSACASLGICDSESGTDAEIDCCVSHCADNADCILGRYRSSPCGGGDTYIENPWNGHGMDHIGDITLIPAAGLGNMVMHDVLVAPLESNTGHGIGIGILNATNLRGGAVTDVFFGELEENPECPQTNLPWVGYNPADGLVYTSNSKNVSCLSAYAIGWNGRASLRRTVRLRTWDGAFLTIVAVGEGEYVQGGDFSESGKLYLVDGADPGGVFVIDVATGVVLEGFHIDFTVNGPLLDGDEMQGISIWDLDDGRAPGMLGEVHVGMLDLELGGNTDKLYFKHLRATYPGNL